MGEYELTMFRSIIIRILIFVVVLSAAACNTASLGPAMIFTIRSNAVQALSTPGATATEAPSQTNTPFLPLAPTEMPKPLFSPTQQQSDTPSLTPTQEPSGTPTPAPVPTLAPPPALAQKPPAAPVAVPAAYDIPGIQGHRQYLSLDCEAAAAEDWASYFGKDFDEIEFQDRLPVSDNPDFGFVGNVNDPWGLLPPRGYGVYAGPVAQLLNAYGLQAKAYKGYTLEQVKEKISRNIPVIAWVVGNVEVGAPPVYYTDAEGRKAVADIYEHVVIITGYTQDRIHFLSEGTFYTTTTDIFLKSWGRLGNMVIVDR